jgi:hypothetical protein
MLPESAVYIPPQTVWFKNYEFYEILKILS